MAKSRGPNEGSYQLPEGTYRELIVKDRMTKFLKKRLPTTKEQREAARWQLPVDEAEAARQRHSDEQARAKAVELAEQEVAAGRPIVVLAWQVQVTRYAHRWSDTAPSWLTTPATATVRVFADDTCEPASP